MSLIRDNLLQRENYTPYCGNEKCMTLSRTFFDGEQFKCPSCNFRTTFDKVFIEQYKNKWRYKKVISKASGKCGHELVYWLSTAIKPEGWYTLKQLATMEECEVSLRGLETRLRNIEKTKTYKDLWDAVSGTKLVPRDTRGKNPTKQKSNVWQKFDELW